MWRPPPAPPTPLPSRLLPSWPFFFFFPCGQVTFASCLRSVWQGRKCPRAARRRKAMTLHTSISRGGLDNYTDRHLTCIAGRRLIYQPPWPLSQGSPPLIYLIMLRLFCFFFFLHHRLPFFGGHRWQIVTKEEEKIVQIVVIRNQTCKHHAEWWCFCARFWINSTLPRSYLVLFLSLSQ